MKKIFSTYILLVCTLIGVNAQATLPYESFSSEDFNNTTLFPSKTNASWSNSDDGRIDMPKGSNFTFSWEGIPGNLSFTAKSEKWGLSVNGKYRLETSSDGGISWVTVVGSVNLGDGYSNQTFALQKNVRMIRLSSVSGSLLGSGCYIRELMLTDYDLTVDSVDVKFIDTKVLNTSSVSIPLRGKNLSGDLTLELAQNNPNFLLPLTSISNEYVEGEEGTSLDVEFSPTELGLHKDTLLIKDGEKNTIRIPLEGNAPAYQAYVTIDAIPSKFSTQYLKSSEAQKFMISALYLISNVAISAPEHFELSTDSIHFSKTLNLDYITLNEVIDTTIFVRLNTSYVGNFSGNILIQNSEAQDSLQEISIHGTSIKAIPQLKEAPKPDRNLNWGEPLSALKFVGGNVVNDKGETLEGTYRWVMNENFIPTIGLTSMTIYFVPNNSYGYETIDCSVNVRVLKRPQTVSWDQEFDDINIGDIITLTAQSSSELPVIYQTNNPEIVRIDNNKLTALAQGRVRVTGTQPGNDYFEAAGGVAYYITVLSPAGLNEHSLPQTVVRWSNRSAGILSVKSEESIKISIMNAQGKVIIPSHYSDPNTLLTFPSSTPSGLYFIQIEYQNGTKEVVKLMK